MISRQTAALRVIMLCGLAAVALAAQPALAADTTGSLNVNATITSNCAVSTTTVAFGNIDVTLNTAVDATGGISVTCTNGVAWITKSNAGTGGAGTSVTHRKMSGGAAGKLSYDLYTDSARTTKWGDGVTSGTSTITGTGTGSAQARTIYGRVRAGNTSAGAGSYSDTVTVTVTY